MKCLMAIIIGLRAGEIVSLLRNDALSWIGAFDHFCIFFMGTWIMIMKIFILTKYVKS